MSDGITLNIVLEHMQRLHQEVMRRIDALDERLSGQIYHLDKKVDRVENRLLFQIDALDKRLDVIEISIVEQKHEKRIRRLERHPDFTAVM